VNTNETLPWRSVYRQGTPIAITPPHRTMLDVFTHAVESAPDQVAIRYFDGALTYTDIDEAADALACALVDNGFRPGDRLALFLQNNPSFVIGLVAAWKAGGIAVAVNPMNTSRELTYLLRDSAATSMLCLDTLLETVLETVSGSALPLDLRRIIVTRTGDFQTRDDDRVLPKADRPLPPEQRDLIEVLGRATAQRFATTSPNPDDAAVLTYTSGITGEPKAAVNTHAAMSFNSYTFREWLGLSVLDSVLGIAPLFHITGLVGHIGAAFAAQCPLILTHRYHPQVMLESIRECRPTFVVGVITALRNLVAASDRPADDFASLRAVYSGGAPVSPAVVEEFRQQTGKYIHNIYGLTETSAPTHATPLGVSAPVDARTGALSVGVPVFNTMVRILDEDGHEVATNDIGEIAVRGPQVISAYWNKPVETAHTIIDGELRTGDIGYMNEDGWFFVIDRKKDMINASGYKVWPREIEDVLYFHPAVREAAVVGVPDPYRGETVKAFVVLREHATCSIDDLQQFCRERMAAYKYPRTIEIVQELPKTLTGKVLRRRLREEHLPPNTAEAVPSEPDPTRR
jgi:long-chain acyl-CoA synthetase